MKLKKKSWATAKSMLRGKFVVLNVCLRKEERSKIKNLSFHFRNIEKEQMKPKASRIKETVKFRTENNKLEIKKHTK